MIPTGGQPSVELMMPVWSPGFYRVENYATNVHGRRRARRRRRGAGRRADAAEPVARRDRRTAFDRPDVRRDLRPGVRDGGLGGRGHGRPERRAHLHHARRAREAAARGAARARARVAEGHDVARPGARRPAEPLPRGRLRRAGGLAHRGRAGSRSTSSRWRASRTISWTPARSTGSTGRAPRVTCSGSWRRRTGSGAPCPIRRYVFLNLFRRGGGGLEHLNSTMLTSNAARLETPKGYLGLARLREPRVLPRVQREAPAPGRARALRLRAPADDEQPVDFRGPHQLLRRADRHAVGPRHSGGLPRGAVRAHPRAAEFAGPAGADARTSPRSTSGTRATRVSARIRRRR